MWAYAANTSLWLDEILLSRNILDLSLAQLLTEPLRLDQVAPRGFLLLVKLSVNIFGPSELALRLVSFLSGIAALLLFRRLADRALSGWAPAFAVLLFAIGVPFLKFGSEVKQYGLDALAAIVLVLIALRLREGTPTTARYAVTGLAAFLIIWFSQASVIVMAGIGIATVIEWLLSRDERARRMALITIPLWALASGLAVYLGMRSMTPATREFMQDFWRGGFLPLPVRSPADLSWFWQRLVELFSDPTLLRYQWPTLVTLLALCGMTVLWKRHRMLALMIAAPVVVAFAGAAAQHYPFRGRLLTYLLPGLLIAVAAALDWIRERTTRFHPLVASAAIAVLLVPPVRAILAAPPPYEIEHNRSVTAHLQQHRQPGDRIYVFPLTRIGFGYYGPQVGIAPHEWDTVPCNRTDTRAYLRDADRYRGEKRVWVISSGARPFRTARAGLQAYFSAIGTKQESLLWRSATMGSVTLDRYDLSDPARLASAGADTFPVAPMPTDPRPGCRPWSEPNAPFRVQ